jgi:hypothetical protein
MMWWGRYPWLSNRFEKKPNNTNPWILRLADDDTTAMQLQALVPNAAGRNTWCLQPALALGLWPMRGLCKVLMMVMMMVMMVMMICRAIRYRVLQPNAAKGSLSIHFEDELLPGLLKRGAKVRWGPQYSHSTAYSVFSSILARAEVQSIA